MKPTITEEVSASSSGVVFVPATEAHCRAIAEDLRGDDLMELRHFLGSDVNPAEGLNKARMLSDRPGCALVDGVPTALLGCEPRDGHGEPWMVGTNQMTAVRNIVFREAKKAVALWKEQYGSLRNSVWAESRAVPWLRRLGFEVGQPFLQRTPSGDLAHYRVFSI